jgi:hypothetical protein
MSGFNASNADVHITIQDVNILLLFLIIFTLPPLLFYLLLLIHSTLSYLRGLPHIKIYPSISPPKIYATLFLVSKIRLS